MVSSGIVNDDDKLCRFCCFKWDMSGKWKAPAHTKVTNNLTSHIFLHKTGICLYKAIQCGLVCCTFLLLLFCFSMGSFITQKVLRLILFVYLLIYLLTNKQTKKRDSVYNLLEIPVQALLTSICWHYYATSLAYTIRLI